jgi:2-polyprenyl-3-methyl-5-hydroxy-6-metoxy-1,4-benzoquinol methylase
MGFVLEHVADPLEIVQRFAGYLKPGGRLFVAVPNALAMHRRLGHLAGMLADMHALSEHDLALGHRRYFDAETLRKLLESAGFGDIRMEGIFLKPVTTAQLQMLNFSEAVLGALVRLGIDYPELSNSLLAEARHA